MECIYWVLHQYLVESLFTLHQLLVSIPCGAFLPHVEKQVVSTFSSSSLKKYKCYVLSEVVEVSPTCSCFSIATLGNINVWCYCNDLQNDIFISHKNILELSWTNKMTQPQQWNLSYTLKKDHCLFQACRWHTHYYVWHLDLSCWFYLTAYGFLTALLCSLLACLPCQKSLISVLESKKKRVSQDIKYVI